VKILNKLNPLGIILEAFTEEFSASGLGDDFQVPKLAQYLSPLATTLWDGFQAVIADFMEFIKGLWSKISDSVSDPSQALEKLKAALQEAFWFIFNTVKTLVKTAWQAVGDFMDAVVHFIEAEWKFPLITSLFEWYAEPVCTGVLLICPR
jgi:phage-related protein